MPKAKKKKNDLLPCPFCGVIPTIEPWHGGSRTKRMVHCENEECFVSPDVTGESYSEAILRWNKRA